MYKSLKRGEILRSTLIVLPAGMAIFVGGRLYTGDERFYREWFMPMVHRFTDAESAHRLALRSLRMGLYVRDTTTYDTLHTTLCGMPLANPVGLAAGFDKDGEAIDALCSVGCGFIEIGSVTPLPQPGNDRPRVFRLLEDEAVINRYGFNSAGFGHVMTNLNRRKTAANTTDVPVLLGVNLGKNKSTSANDAHLNYMTGMQNMGDKCEYVVINVSSPNTPGLRDLQTTQHLKTIITSVQQARKRLADGRVPPRILLKISPDLNTADMKEIANVCMKLSIDGVIIGNTTLERPSFLTSEHKIESGGLSGAPLRTLTRSKIHEFYTLTKGRITIVGCGGVSNGRDAYEHIRAGEVDKCPGCECAPVCAGASAVQLYTAIVYQGWPVFARVKRELHECLLNDGFTNVSQAVGADHRKK